MTDLVERIGAMYKLNNLVDDDFTLFGRFKRILR